jgi:hypothetical protein
MSKRASGSGVAQRETAWRNRLARFAAAKQTVEAFCRNEAVSVASFYGWRTRLRNSQGEALAAPRALAVAATSPFIDLGSISHRATSTTASIDTQVAHHEPASINIRLDLGGGMVLHIARP